MRIVIVGGAGFLGNAIARRIVAEAWQPLILDTGERIARSKLRLPAVEHAPFDFVGDRDAGRWLQGAQALVHFGCTTNPALSMQDLAYDAESNIGPSVRLFAAAADAGIGRIVFASSGGTVYGAPERLPVHEDDRVRPLSGYGVSKWTIERYLALNPRVQGVSLRVSNPYGPQQLEGAAIGIIANYLACVHRGAPLQVWGDGSIVRDYLAVEDVADAFVAALAAPALAHDTYNIGSGEGHSIVQVIEAVFRAAGREVPVEFLPGRHYDVPAIVLDSTRFRAETGWRPAIGLDAGVARLWAELQKR